MLAISIEGQGLELLKAQLDPTVFTKIHRTTVNEIVNNSFKKSHKEIKGKWNIEIKKDGRDWVFANKQSGKFGKRNGRMRITRATIRSNTVIIDIIGTPLNLSLFEYSWNMEVQSKKKFSTKRKVAQKKARLDKKTRGKIRVKILKGQVKTLDHVFAAVMANGHRGIFRRKTNRPSPIAEQRVISPVSMFEQIDFDSLVSKEFDSNMLKRFNHNLERWSNGYWK